MNFNLIKTQIARNVFSVGSGQPSGCVRCGFRTAVNGKCGQRLNDLLVNKLRQKSITYAIRRPVMSVSSHSSSSVSIRNLSSKGDQTSDNDPSDPNEMDELPTDDEDLFHEPPKVRFGLLKVALTIALGTYAGALFAMFGANFLEEFEIFVKEDDDEDD